MDWVRLGNSGVDLTGVGGVLRDVTPEQLAAHSKKNDAWIAIRGKSDHGTSVNKFVVCT
jgi:cytochrome-b5 reductase